jgi:hypothetical protein
MRISCTLCLVAIVALASRSAFADPSASAPSATAQRVQLDYLQELNRSAVESGIDPAAVEGVIDSYELAFRM